ncbi:alkaline phosphatase family protein [Acaryochloris sp. IP29b_bin.137]|uniref:alkaline phosphatase family protein n=1 Tax=Acaryochloris sp. IP29b_bin.137 TaxID=2969217 RepID=UPI0026065EFF|nr:alkaline phosphatase family protein [Acaryochloris sp. IP29b_bin.137]
MKQPVIAIGLDAADPNLLETWMSQGYLQNLKRLREQGAYGRLSNIDYYKAETPWTTFLTGCLPDKTGYWSPLKFWEGTYNVEQIEAYSFDEYAPFYDLGDQYRVATFDLPQSTLARDVNGVQVLAWGAHSPQTPSCSKPNELLEALNERHGKHPALHKDHGDWWDQAYLHRLRQSLISGLKQRVNICRDLLQQDQWDLFLTIFGETHSAGHDLWFMSQSDHPLYEYGKGQLGTEDPMLDVFDAADQAIGEILDAAPEDATVVVFAAHGSGSNITDVASMLFLPEFLYRFSFPGKTMLAPGHKSATVPPVITSPNTKSWTSDIWQRKHIANPFERFLRKRLPTRYHRYIDRLGSFRAHRLISPGQLQKRGVPLFWQPTLWYKLLWPHMKAFALPSFSEGYIRVNLQGREPNGLVPPEEYDSLCDELIQQLNLIVNPRTGESVVKKVRRTRQSAHDNDPKLPDADLVVEWTDMPADVIDHSQFGRIGPVPYRRTGSHRSQGFLIMKGPDIASGTTLPIGHGVDLAPTILDLMDAPIPDYFDGQSLVQPVLQKSGT